MPLESSEFESANESSAIASRRWMYLSYSHEEESNISARIGIKFLSTLFRTFSSESVKETARRATIRLKWF